ncbi:MAG: hypothetical protein JO129_03620 [Candidatus Dependentiae bacterium]|nr:hypothetical protein [Candidatus Dependentiae bacterium]
MIYLRSTPSILSVLKKGSVIKTIFLFTLICTSFNITSSQKISRFPISALYASPLIQTTYTNPQDSNSTQETTPLVTPQEATATKRQETQASNVAAEIINLESRVSFTNQDLNRTEDADATNNDAEAANSSEQASAAANTNNAPIKTTTPSEQTSTPAASPQGSNIWTKAWHGAAKWVAGKTDTATFFELNDEGILEADLKNNPKEAISRFYNALAERFTRRNRYNPENQDKLHTIFAIVNSLSKKTGKDFNVGKIVAEVYNPLQENALEVTIIYHLDELKTLERNRDAIIAEAHKNFEVDFENLRNIAVKMAETKRNLTECAKSNPSELEDARSYADQNAYKSFLEKVGPELKKKKSTKDLENLKEKINSKLPIIL